MCLGVNDTEESQRLSVDGLLSIIRFLSGNNWSIRLKRIQQLINQVMPDWISLQYVPYGYDYKGLPLSFVHGLSRIHSSARWHFMFHELWVGICQKSPAKHKLIGFLQRNLAKSLVAKIAPDVVHTTNQLYVYLLSKQKIGVEHLPLFGNIPVDQSESKWMVAQLETLGMNSTNRQRWFIVGMFGSIYPDFPLERQILNISSLALASNKELAILGIGCGRGTGAVWEQRITCMLPNIKVRHLGSQSNERVSAFLSSLDLGLPTTPLEFLGKSSSVASMVLHGVPLDLSYQMDFSDFRFLSEEALPLSEIFSTVEGVCDKLMVKLHAVQDRSLDQPCLEAI